MLSFLLNFILAPHLLWASNSYMASPPSLVTQAIQNEYGVTAGIGPKEGQCILCHNSETGGQHNLNPYFGMDFSETSLALGFGRGGNNLQLWQLQDIFAHPMMADRDSDGDGVINSEEFINNNDPSKNVAGQPGGGGGCGTLRKPPLGPDQNPWIWVLVLPVLILGTLKLRLHRSLS